MIYIIVIESLARARSRVFTYECPVDHDVKLRRIYHVPSQRRQNCMARELSVVAKDQSTTIIREESSYPCHEEPKCNRKFSPTLDSKGSVCRTPETARIVLLRKSINEYHHSDHNRGEYTKH
jgi:hypothetical protein